MRYGILTVAATAALLLGTAPGADAQTSDAGWWEWALPEVTDVVRGERGEQARRGQADRDDRRYDPRQAPRQGDYRGAEQRRQGNGPPFCQNRQGHPVHGWAWCVDKGWAGYGARDARYGDSRDRGWIPTSWEDVILGTPESRRRGDRVVEPTLGGILGDIVLQRLAGHRDRTGATGALSGRWLMEDGARVLQVRAGERPLAEFTDLDGDGRADATLLIGVR